MNRLPRPKFLYTAARVLSGAVVVALASCSFAPQRATKPSRPAPAPHYATPLSRATTVDAYEREVAERVQQASAVEVYPGRPQFFLRAVIVFQMQIDAAGRPVRVDLFRAPDKAGATALVRRARVSVRRAAPFPRPGPSLLEGGRTVALMETWLFDDDGRFRLRAASKPQETGAQALKRIHYEEIRTARLHRDPSR